MDAKSPTLEIDPETLALLRETGIDPQAYLKRQAELAARTISAEAAAKLAAEQEALREEIESANRLFDQHGLWSDGLRAW